MYFYILLGDHLVFSDVFFGNILIIRSSKQMYYLNNLN